MNVVVYITGVSGSGKTTVGRRLSAVLGIPFADGDDFHPPENIRKMQSGTPLDDDDRWPWLEAINRFAREQQRATSVVIACSALKEAYRERLAAGLAPDAYRWVHLRGDYDAIYRRLAERSAHFMPASLLRSQFDAYEPPRSGLVLDVDQALERLIFLILQNMSKPTAELGLIGLGVMGKSLARNLGRRGVALSLYNRHLPGKEEGVARQCVLDFPELAQAQPFDDLTAFVASLTRPRRILLMVNAGPAVEAVLDLLLPLLEPGDAVADGGNSHYADTRRRQEALHARGILYLGIGISGGEAGALNGPAIMPGGDAAAYALFEPYLQRIAARDPDGAPCCAYIGPDGAGHFVKMVHNGIEYAEMQLLAEVYTLLRCDLEIEPAAIADLLDAWQQTGLQSYLLGITVDILRYREPDGGLLLDRILDKAENKGTGGWTTVAACELGVPAPVLTAALFARYQSAFKAERTALDHHYQGPGKRIELPLEMLRDAYAFARIVNHHQGFQLIREAGRQYQWVLDLPRLAGVWTNGCILRSALMQELAAWLETAPDLLAHPAVVARLTALRPALAATAAAMARSRHAYPCFLAALSAFNGATTAQSGANLLQAQRDYFGAHTYERTDDPGGRKHHTQWTD